MRLARSKALVACLAVLAAAALSACGGSSDNSERRGGRHVRCRGEGRHLLEPPAARPVGRRGDPARERDQARAGPGRRQGGPVHRQYTALDDSTGVGGWDASETAANAARGRGRPARRLLHRGVRRRRQRGLDADPEPGRDRAGQPRQHIRRAHHGRARERLGRADRYAPTGTRTLPADRADRLGPGRGRPAGDAPGGLHQGRARQRRRGLRHGPGEADRVCRRATTGSTSSATPGSIRRRRASSSYAATLKAPPRRLRPARRRRLKGRRRADQGGPRRAADGQDLRAPRTCARAPGRTPGRRGARRDRPADRVHRGDPEPDRLPRRQGVPGGLQGQVPGLESEPVRDPRLRGDEARAEHDRRPRRQRRQQVGRPERAVRHHRPALGARHLQLQQGRRHDAQVDRALQGRREREPDVPKTITPARVL